MVSKAIAKYQRISWKRARLVANEVRGCGAEEALAKLKFTPSKAAKLFYKVIRSAIANAESAKSYYDTSKLIITDVRVDQGPVLKRFTPKAQGRASAIRKPTSHLSVVLSEKNVNSLEKMEVASGS